MDNHPAHEHKPLELRQAQPFARGGNRLCFVHPDYPERCIKVRRPDFSLEDLRRSKGFPKNLKPLSSFDDNAEELRVMQQLQQSYGDKAFRHISRCFGFTNTDLGKGLVSELIRDGSGKISFSLKQYLIDLGYTPTLDSAINDFCRFWEKQGIPSRDLILHNLVVQQDDNGNVIRLVVIDGLGSPHLIPPHWCPKSYQRRKAARKVADFHRRIDKLRREIKDGKVFSQLGQLLHDGTNQ